MAGKVTQKLQNYTQAYLAGLCVDYNDVVEEIQENRIHPNRNHKPKERITFLQNLADEKLDYIRQVIADLKRLK